MLPPISQPKCKVDQSYRKKHVRFQLIRQFQTGRRQPLPWDYFRVARRSGTIRYEGRIESAFRVDQDL